MKVLPGLAPRIRIAGITQSELARRLGVGRATVSQWVCGGAYPSTVLLPALAEALGCSIDDLFSESVLLIPPGAEEASTEFYPWEVR